MKTSDVSRLLDDPLVPERLHDITHRARRLLADAATVKVDTGSGSKVSTEQLIPIYERRLKRAAADARWPIGVRESLDLFRQKAQFLTFVSCFLDEAFVIYLWIDGRNKLVGCIAGPNNSDHLDRSPPPSSD